MYSKNFYNKIPRFLLSAFIINLFIWNLLLPIKTAAAACDPNTRTCHNCNPETSKCEKCEVAPCEYSCNIKCNAACSGEDSSSDNPDSPLTSSCGTVPVYIVGSQEEDIAETIASSQINNISDLADLTGLAETAKKDFIDQIYSNLPIPSKYKDFAIQEIEKSNLSSSDKENLINIIEKGLPIPENLQDKFAEVIDNLKDVTSLVENKLLDLIKSGLDVSWICNSLANAATALPWGIGAVVSQAIALACPPLLNNLLSSLGFFDIKQEVEKTMTQTIPVPTFKFFKWEVGLPGFIKSGQIIEFK
jgi:hypothetical protein